MTTVYHSCETKTTDAFNWNFRVLIFYTVVGFVNVHRYVGKHTETFHEHGCRTASNEVIAW